MAPAPLPDCDEPCGSFFMNMRSAICITLVLLVVACSPGAVENQDANAAGPAFGMPVFKTFPPRDDFDPTRPRRQKDRMRNHAKWQALVQLEQNRGYRHEQRAQSSSSIDQEAFVGTNSAS